MKLAESLNKQQQMANSRLGDVPTATMLSLTPPLSRQSAASQDSSERASLNSKDSAELATDNLLDLQVPPPPRPLRHDEGSSDSDPLTSSSEEEECVIPRTWETFGDEPPPVPPPRSKLKAPKLIAKQRTSTLIQGSTVDDFGASIAETLYARGRRDTPDSSVCTLFPSDLEFFRTLGLEKPSSDLPHPMVPASVSRISWMVTTPAPLPSNPLVPTPAPLVPTFAPLVPTFAPLVPTPAPLVPTPAPLVSNPFPLVQLVPCPPVPLFMVPSTSDEAVLSSTFQTTAGAASSSTFQTTAGAPSSSTFQTTAGAVSSSTFQTTAGAVSSSASQSSTITTPPFPLRSRSVYATSNGYLPGQHSRGSPTPSNLSSPPREGSAQRLSGQSASGRSADTVESSVALSSKPSKSTNPFSVAENRDTAQVRPRLGDDPFMDLVKQTMARNREGKQQS